VRGSGRDMKYDAYTLEFKARRYGFFEGSRFLRQICSTRQIQRKHCKKILPAQFIDDAARTVPELHASASRVDIFPLINWQLHSDSVLPQAVSSVDYRSRYLTGASRYSAHFQGQNSKLIAIYPISLTSTRLQPTVDLRASSSRCPHVAPSDHRCQHGTCARHSTSHGSSCP
jgi:hypothetical protein